MIHIILCAAAITSFTGAAAAPKSYYIHPLDGDDDATGLNRTNPLRTVQVGLNKASNADSIFLNSELFTGGELCVQNILAGGSLEEPGTHWLVSGGASIVRGNDHFAHAGSNALLLAPPAPSRYNSGSGQQKSSSVAQHPVDVTVVPTYRYRFRAWTRAVPIDSTVEPSSSVCGVIALSAAHGANRGDSKKVAVTVASISCDVRLRWQLHEWWASPGELSSSGPNATTNVTVTVTLTDTSGNFSLVVDDVSFVPFPGQAAALTFWSDAVEDTCVARLPLSGIAGHVTGARSTDKFCEMKLASGGWSLFAVDGAGNKEVHRATLRGDSDGVGTILPGTTNVTSVSLFKQKNSYFGAGGAGSTFKELLIVIRRRSNSNSSMAAADHQHRWIKVRRSSSGTLVPSKTLFDDIARPPNDDAWVVETDTGKSEFSWPAGCQQIPAGLDASFVLPNAGASDNLLRCRTFWRHLSSYTLVKQRGWKCDTRSRLFHNNGGAGVSLDGCFEWCLSVHDCQYFTSHPGAWCVGCSEPTFEVGQATTVTETYRVVTPFTPTFAENDRAEASLTVPLMLLGDSGDSSSSSYFGSAVAMTENWIIVGSYGEKKAYIFLNNGAWGTDSASRDAAFTLSQSNKQSFGRSVAITDDYALVGAPDANRAFVYKKNSDSTWETSPVCTLQQSSNGNFGSSVALSTTGWAIVGDSNAKKISFFEITDGSGSGSGSSSGSGSDSATCQRQSTMFEQQDAGAAAPEAFGVAVAMTSDWVLVGAHTARKAFLYTRRSLSELQVRRRKKIGCFFLFFFDIFFSLLFFSLFFSGRTPLFSCSVVGHHLFNRVGDSQQHPQHG